jgi:hypothetical protein
VRFSWKAENSAGQNGRDPFDEYYFKDFPPHHRGGPWCCEVAKFNFRRRPEAVYLVERRTRQGQFIWNCDCPAGRECKHIRMVKEWVAAGMPTPRWMR